MKGGSRRSRGWAADWPGLTCVVVCFCERLPADPDTSGASGLVRPSARADLGFRCASAPRSDTSRGGARELSPSHSKIRSVGLARDDVRALRSRLPLERRRDLRDQQRQRYPPRCAGAQPSRCWRRCWEPPICPSTSSRSAAARHRRQPAPAPGPGRRHHPPPTAAPTAGARPARSSLHHPRPTRAHRRSVSRRAYGNGGVRPRNGCYLRGHLDLVSDGIGKRDRWEAASVVVKVGAGTRREPAALPLRADPAARARRARTPHGPPPRPASSTTRPRTRCCPAPPNSSPSPTTAPQVRDRVSGTPVASGAPVG